MSPASVFSNANIRRGAFALAIAGVTALTAITGASPAQAQEPIQIATVTLDTDCSKYKVGELFANTQCEIYKSQILQQQAQALNQQGQQLDAELAAKQVINECLGKIKSAVDAGLVTRDQLQGLNKQNACAVAGQLGQG